MHATTQMTEKWTLYVNAERLSKGPRRFLSRYDRIREPFQRAQNDVERSSDGCWIVARDTVTHQEFFKPSSARFVVLHDVVTGAAVHVNIDQPRRENVLSEIYALRATRYFRSGLGRDAGDAPVFNNDQWALDAVERREESSGGESKHEMEKPV